MIKVKESTVLHTAAAGLLRPGLACLALEGSKKGSGPGSGTGSGTGFRRERVSILHQRNTLSHGRAWEWWTGREKKNGHGRGRDTGGGCCGWSRR
ncbi:hypothetical protein COCMIDRAFT_106403 [Bipolaris oryzae ATCC 44560]|uniref:Uncharacterized protein n=1 Tax=Bipolaris oryzae ATCC 44560 TaxID=930090 RepID=W6Z0Z4_COCMI|nr:uncharacterized protein COCMIDRAFT_106403 [Bipolaris oryzae ATCC 44560]EUC41339.1 hypothetical protein COCMIDRAFT_106403 [Bipolaris oryzae ATCC 44560]